MHRGNRRCCSANRQCCSAIGIGSAARRLGGMAGQVRSRRRQKEGDSGVNGRDPDIDEDSSNILPPS